MWSKYAVMFEEPQRNVVSLMAHNCNGFHIGWQYASIAFICTNWDEHNNSGK